MASFKSKMFGFMVRNGHLLRGKLKKETFDMNTSITAFREQCEERGRRYAKIPAGITIKEEIIEGMRSEWLIPEGADAEKLILYVHGGGYVSGSCSDHRGFVSKFASYTGITNLVYEYRLAPEHPFPAALEDSVKIYRWILTKGYTPENILMAGESAGGGLCLAMLLKLKELGLPMPAAAVAISPWTDLTCSGESYTTKNRLSPAPMHSWTVFSNHYTAGKDPANPLISPLFGELNGLPPIFLNSAENDELYDDGENFFLKAREAGVEITFRKGVGMIHCYPLLAPMFREATEAMDEIVAFVKKHINEPGD
jgi:epsilon-lactone hydrolase